MGQPDPYCEFCRRPVSVTNQTFAPAHTERQNLAGGGHSAIFSDAHRGGSLLDVVDRRVSPPTWRVVLGFAVAPAAAALLFALLVPAYDGLPSHFDRVWRSSLTYLLVGGYPAALLLGIPAFIVLKTRVNPTPLNCGLAGAAIASLPWLLLSLLSAPNFASTDGHVTYNNGVITAYGLMNLATLVGEVAGLGFFAGLVFWAVVALGLRESSVR